MEVDLAVMLIAPTTFTLPRMSMNKRVELCAIAMMAVSLFIAVYPAAAKRGKRVSSRAVAGNNTISDSAPVILGCPTDVSVTLNILCSRDSDGYFEYGTETSIYTYRTDTELYPAGEPTETVVEGLHPDTRYYYRMRSRDSGRGEFLAGDEHSFHTQRATGSKFTFCVQGDSHPERFNKMFDPDLYMRTMENVVRDNPDFYFTIGDDFSIERLIEKDLLNQESVDNIYLNQRRFLGEVGSSSALFLVNGNHEQAAQYLLDGTPNNPAVLAGRARNKVYSLPAPNSFYSGDLEEVEFVGLLRDYYAFEWGDALFVVIDPYWHSPVAVDKEPQVNNFPLGMADSPGVWRTKWESY